MAYIACVALFLMIFYEGIEIIIFYCYALKVHIFTGIESGTAGLTFSMGLGLTGMLQWGVRQSAEVRLQVFISILYFKLFLLLGGESNDISRKNYRVLKT